MKSNLAAEKKAAAVAGTIATEDPTKKVMAEFKGLQGQLIGALNKEMKFEQLVEDEELEKQNSNEKGR